MKPALTEQELKDAPDTMPRATLPPEAEHSAAPRTKKYPTKVSMEPALIVEPSTVPVFWITLFVAGFGAAAVWVFSGMQ